MVYERFITFFIFSASLVLLFPVQVSEANHNICFTCQTTTDLNSYSRLDVAVYIENAQRGLINNVLNKLNSDVQTYTFKDIPIVVDEFLVDRDGILTVVRAGLVFENSSDALTAMTELDTLLNSGSARNRVVYAEFILTDNTHHYFNPLPDIDISRTTLGEFNNLATYETGIRG